MRMKPSMETALVVPSLYITSEILNSYICPTPGVAHTVPLLHLAADCHFLATIATILSITTVYTMLQALWAQWAGPSEDQMPLPVGLPLSVSRDVLIGGRRCLMRNKDPAIRFD